MNLQKIRKNKGFTQKQLADLSGVSLRTIQTYEAGYRKIDGASLDILTALALSLNVPLYDLLENDTLRTRVKQTTAH